MESNILSVIGPTFSGLLLLVISGWIQGGKDKKTQVNQAKEAIATAVHRTESYLEYQREGGVRIKDREKELARLWEAAGQELAHIARTQQENDLVQRLRMKSGVWEYRGSWPQAKIDEARIGFNTVKTELEKLSMV